MATLIVANRQATAKAYFDKADLDEYQEDYYIGVRGQLHGMRFDLIKFIEPVTVDQKMWDWFTRELLCRSKNGEVVWEPQ